ncbi:beta-phosphoglucomutase family hydrolase [Actinopolymorpha sp. B11F2]|uniref:HAD family hydrolase n=1 Tax=Actinopolymorpha sp. B11F2 TaxID=3160862 RepID=UPI0032E437FA
MSCSPVATAGIMGSVMIGLPAGIAACLFDLDGVLTNTASLHRQAWKQTFDAFLTRRDGADFTAFSERDYLQYVDGRPRDDGVRGFLRSRGIQVPEGSPDDSPTSDTVHGIGSRKDTLFLAIVKERGVTAYPGSVRYLHAVHDAGLSVGVVTSSANGELILDTAGLSRFVQARIDGVVIAERGLRGKPEPDSYLAGAEALGMAPSQAAVFEDALAGVQAGRAGSFGLVVGVDRTHHADALRAHGADLVVSDLAELLAVHR